MTPELIAIITVCVVGLGSFLIGWLLMDSSWRRKYTEVKGKEDTWLTQKNFAEEKVLKLQKEKAKMQEALRKSQVSFEELKSLRHRNKDILADNGKLKRALEKKNHSSNETADLMEMKQLYHQEQRERERLEAERELLREQLNGQDKQGKQVTHHVGSVKSSQVRQKTKPMNSNGKVKGNLSTLFNKIGLADTEAKDDLTRIRGINKKTQTKLRDLGINSYKQVKALETDDLALLNEVLGFSAGHIESENWAAQAIVLQRYKEDGRL